MDDCGELLQPVLVLPAVMAAEEQLTASGKDCPDGCLGAAAIAAVGGSQSKWRGRDSGHWYPPDDRVGRCRVPLSAVYSLLPFVRMGLRRDPLQLVQMAVDMQTGLSGN